ncbi:hypothetical protein KSS87_004491 [Heliosperma pusillum]|nr:hypothetical protein KSS87_004491 [Heliosperma pusillum]
MAATEEVPLDDKAKRMRDLLSSFYSTDHTNSSNYGVVSSKYATLDTINSPSFDADHYMNLLVQKSNMETLLQRHVEMAAEIKNLDTDLQMLVMNNNIVGMEANMEQLLDKILSVQSRSDGVNTSLFEKREHIEKMHRTRNLLRKVQFIYDLPERLAKCIKSEAYADAVKYYTGAMPIFKAYGDSSFQDCKKASEEAVGIIIEKLQADFMLWLVSRCDEYKFREKYQSRISCLKLRSNILTPYFVTMEYVMIWYAFQCSCSFFVGSQGKLFSDAESIQTRAEAVMLLQQLDFPVDNLKEQLFEKLEQSLGDLQLDFDDKTSNLAKSDECAKQESPDQLPAAHELSTREYVEAVRAYRVIFPDSEQQLIKISHELVTRHFETIQKRIRIHISSADMLRKLRLIWEDVLLMDEVLPEARVADVCLEATNHAVKQYIASTFSHLLQDISDSLIRVQSGQKEVMKEDHPLQAVLEASKKAIIQGSMGVLLDFRQLLDDNLALLVRLRDLVIVWVQEGFQDFFITLHNQFLVISGKTDSASQQHAFPDSIQGDKTVAGLVLVLSQLSVFIEQNAIPRITEARLLDLLDSSYVCITMVVKSLLVFRKLLPHFLMAVLGVVSLDLHLFLQKYAEYSGQLVKSFYTLYEFSYCNFPISLIYEQTDDPYSLGLEF